MKEKKLLRVLFIFWVILAISSAAWIVFHILTDFSIFLRQSLYQFVFVFCFFSLILAFLSVKGIIKDVNSNIEENNRKESSVRDYYQYCQLLEPPELNN
jgi:hypothetical protein